MNETLNRFDEVADEYDRFVEKIPKYERITGTLFEVLDQLNRESPPESIAELGVGTGGIASRVLERFQPKQFHGVDGSEAMLNEARSRLASYQEVSVELGCVTFEEWQPDGEYDWFYSNLSIHHLYDLEKRGLFERIQRALAPGGSFLLSDLVRIPEKRFDLYREIYWSRLEAMGFGESEIEDRWARHREHDVPADLRAMLRWLRDAGFSTVECVWKDFNRAIILASKRNGAGTPV